MSDQTERQIFDFSIQALIFVLILTVYVVLSYLIQLKNIKFLHESTVAIFMGVLTAVFCKYALGTTISFSNQIFFSIILPPIIFSAGFSLRKSNFFGNIGLICFYGIIGTVIGFILITLILIFLDRALFHSLTLIQLMIIGSVLCATDTLASVTLIKPQKFPVLHSVLFGQSIINDAVAIILFRAVSEIEQTQDQKIGYQIILKISFSFLYLFFFSVLLGVVSGFFLSYMFRKFRFFSTHPIKQTSMILLNGYFTYLLGQIFSLSGIITLFTHSIIIGHYAIMNLSQQSKKGTGMAFQTVSYIAQAFVFAYLGASILSITSNGIAVLMAICLLLFLPLVRAIIVYILPIFFKVCKKQFYLKPKELKVCWFSGMIRGVIAFALCLQIQSANKQFITSLVLVIVIFTTVGGSSFLNKFIQLIKLQGSTQIQQLENLNQNHLNEVNQNKEDNLTQDITSKQSFPIPQNRSRIVKKLMRFQKKYIKPFFGKISQDDLSERGNQKRSKSKKVLSGNYNNLNIDTNKTKQVIGQTYQLPQISSTKTRSGSTNLSDWKPF